MAPDSNDTQLTQQLSSLPDGVHKEEALDVTDVRTKTRHPRWTRQETFVLIQGKKFAENRVQRGRGSTSVWGSDKNEPKWDSVSSYCKQHHVNREPVQCRKRWSNLLGDFKKIKAWESQKKDEAESFWLMRNELRKEKKLPSFFDKEVYDVLDGRAFTTEAIPLAHIIVKTEMNDVDGCEAATAEEEEEEEQAETQTVFDGGQHAKANGLFSDCEQSGQVEIGCSSKKETISSENPRKTKANPLLISGNIVNLKFPLPLSSLHQIKSKIPSNNELQIYIFLLAFVHQIIANLLCDTVPIFYSIVRLFFSLIRHEIILLGVLQPR